MSLQLAQTDLTPAGQVKLEDDFQTVERRDSGKTSRQDFALGWMACAQRFGIKSVFTESARGRLWP